MSPAVVATSVGSLPHLDPAAAAALVLRTQPSLPAAPQLVSRGEGMLVQLLAWMTGVEPGPAGTLRAVGDVRWIRPSPVLPPSLPGERWDGARALLDQRAAVPVAGAVKVQLAGPVTLAMALHRAGMTVAASESMADEVVEAAVDSLLTAATAGRSVVLVLDEPVLGGPGAEATGAKRAVARLGRLLASAASRPGVHAGVHCCAPGGAAASVGAGAEVVSVPLSCVGAADAAALCVHVRDGGLVIWGVLPSDGSVPGPAGQIAHRLERWWHAHPGPDWTARAAISPDCGLGLRSVSEAETVLERGAEVARLLTAAEPPGAGA